MIVGPTPRVLGLDARAVLVSSLLLVLACKGLHRPIELGVGAAILTGLAVLLRIPPGQFARRLAWVLPFCLAALPLLFTVPGPPLLQLGALTATVSGGLKFLEVTAHCLLCLGVILLASYLCGPFELVAALGRLGCPRPLVAVLSLCLRYLELLAEELSRLQRARQSRGCHEPGLVFRARVTGQLAGTLFLRSLARAERVEMAMRSRGGSGAGSLAQALPSRWGAHETALVGLSGLVAGACWML